MGSNGFVVLWWGGLWYSQDREGPEPCWKQASDRLVNCFEPGSSQSGGHGVAFLLFKSDSTDSPVARR